MERRKVLPILLLVFVLLLGGAYVLYTRLSGSMNPGQLISSGQPSNRPSDETPEKIPAPDFTVYDADGNEVSLSDFLGHPVVLNFWSSRCGPCKMEMPDFDEKYQEIGEDVQFLMVNVTDGSWDTLDSATAFIAEQGYTFPVFYDTQNDAAYQYGGSSSLPLTYFIDTEGYTAARAMGAIDSELLQQGIDLIYQAD